MEFVACGDEHIVSMKGFLLKDCEVGRVYNKFYEKVRNKIVAIDIRLHAFVY